MIPFSVSIIIPAHNAAATLAETTASLLSQTTSHWEAIIVDDGSVDETGAIANQFANQDSRIRVVTQANQGVSAARNTGVQFARAEWLLFLDADDWIATTYLSQIATKIHEDASLDAVHCGWARVAPDGFLVYGKPVPQSTDLFSTLAHYCPFAVHACVVKKDVFNRVGGFDTSLKTCEDWDLWQRIARQGTRFGGIPDTLAYYRMRAQSLSSDGTQFFVDGLRVLKQGHTPDPRVSNPHPDYEDGLPGDTLNSLQFHWATWPAGLVIGLSKNTSPLLTLLNGTAPNLDPYCIAASLFESVPLPTCCPPTKWWQLWQDINLSLQHFLVALEHASAAQGLVKRVNIILERMILEHAADVPWPLQLGHTYGTVLEATQPIVDIIPPAGVERLYGIVTVAGLRLGVLELPVCDGQISKIVLKDSIVAQFYWQILGCFYKETVYQKQAISNGVDTDDWNTQHNQIGWTTFLQDFWDRPDWSGENFYDATHVDPSPQTLQPDSHAITVEVSCPLSDVIVANSDVSDLKVTLTVGGIPFGLFTVPVHNGKVSAQALRVALTLEGGVELCRVSVREAFVGQPITPNLTLRQGLAIAAQAQLQHRPTHPASCSASLSKEFVELSHTLLFGQRHQMLGSSSSRWASLPTQTAEALMDMAKATGEAIAQTPDPHQPIQRVMYAPDILPLARSTQPNRAKGVISSEESANPASVQVGFNNRDYFETLFATCPDPWKYTIGYEQTKYEQTLSLLPTEKITRALELACAEGHFTAQLAPRVQSLIATDISQIAVDRTAQRCAQFSHIQFKQLDMAIDPLPESLQLIVCSEVLYYMDGWGALENFAQKAVNALEPGGYFLTAHAHLVVDEPDRTGYNWDHPFGAKGISDTFMKVKNLRLVKEIRTPLYRIQLYQKSGRNWMPWKKHSPSIVEIPQPTPPPEAVASMVLWHGGKPCKNNTQPITTNRLPILMYHRIAPTGAADLNQWRLSPEMFAEQLCYLRDAGYYSVSLAAWQKAIATKQPLPGRAIVLTFDDGYLDFFEHAYPALKKYGFSATVFLVADRVGQSNQWDAVYGEDVQLMDWPQIRQLQAQGIEFGSHTATHRHLTALSIEDIVQESGRSRAILTEELGHPIQTIAYPYGEVDPVVQHLVGACGYTMGLSCRPGHSSFQDTLLLLPRIEVKGSTSLQEFVRALNPNQAEHRPRSHPTHQLT
ncbi:trifunctional glycosyltransferase/class I SAM-dependent methyltransferase/polysaccharide deacetylase [Nodosilinea nodulosa]|uniref:trifunctional glycosyltransferase/class I SAM-dependent methyltransferase/polysaccharide deacetylase n=1 Tax=Nodosilinea nodulosa TaxID=416001 RepID=UPI0002EF5248|nr:trifunctional glycosyltransferase/class I SAM-dependent methyltransferase/polysaccharide deacetylase [Nodosilinea nodulosa]